MNSGFVLECKDLSKRYGARTALEGVNISIPKGRIVGLLGPNGSGKTTFMKIANGLLVPSAGSISICGNAPGVETKKAISYLPDANYLPEWMTVSRLLKMYSEFFEDFDPAKAGDMIKRLGIDEKQHLKALSKGTREKVQLILAMSRAASLYMLDEPIGGIDPAARDYVLNTIIGNYNEEGSVLISTHLIRDIEQILDDVIFINNGHVVLCKSVDEIREENGMSVDEYFREVFRC